MGHGPWGMIIAGNEAMNAGRFSVFIGWAIAKAEQAEQKQKGGDRAMIGQRRI